MSVVLICDRCSKLLRANHIVSMCASCQHHEGKWARMTTAAELGHAARRALRRWLR